MALGHLNIKRSRKRGFSNGDGEGANAKVDVKGRNCDVLDSV